MSPLPLYTTNTCTAADASPGALLTTADISAPADADATAHAKADATAPSTADTAACFTANAAILTYTTEK